MRRTNCRDDEVLQELRNGAGVGDGLRGKWRSFTSRSLIMDQRAFRVFIRTKSVALDSGVDLFTDFAARGSIYGSHSHRLDDAAAQSAETLPGCVDCCSTWLLSATAGSALAGESVV